MNLKENRLENVLSIIRIIYMTEDEPVQAFVQDFPQSLQGFIITGFASGLHADYYTGNCKNTLACYTLIKHGL
jgi:hypothetical protein